MKITFRTTPSLAWTAKPAPALKFAPEWFKRLAHYVVPTADEVQAGATVISTAKRCSPFQDSLGAGYIIPLPVKVTVSCSDNGEVSISWGQAMLETAPFQVISRHATEQLKGMGLEEGGVFKFNLPWSVELPEGYSALYTHPLNRPDLPFQTFSGIVDNDQYMSPVNIPFIWIGPPGLYELDAGTPVVQIIPFKREEWHHTTETTDIATLWHDGNVANNTVDGYSRKFRTPKKFR